MLTRKIYALAISIVLLSVLSCSTLAHASTANRMVSYIKIPGAPGPYPNARDLSLKAYYNITVLGNVSLSRNCVNLTSYVEKYPGFNVIDTILGNDFSVELCTVVEKPSVLLINHSNIIKIPFTENILYRNVSGGNLKLLFIEGSGTYININFTITIWASPLQYLIFKGDTYITLSEAQTYFDRSTGLLEGYIYATSAFPQRIVNLALALVNQYLPYCWWGIAGRVMMTLLDVFDYISIVAATGLRSRTLSGACLGDICVVCNASWNALEGLLSMIEAGLFPSTTVSGLYEKAPNCVVVNRTSGEFINIEQKSNLIVYIYEEYNNLMHSSKINLVIPSCNRYFCTVKFEEMYPIKQLNLENVKSSVTSFYTLLSYGFRSLCCGFCCRCYNVPVYNLTLYARESAYVVYNYTHVITVKSYALVPVLNVTSSSVEESIARVPMLTGLVVSNRYPVEREGDTYYIYYVNNSAINIEVPTYKDITYTISYYGYSLKARYICRLYKVENAELLNESAENSTIRVEAYSDKNVLLYYKCNFATPIPYLTNISCLLTGPSIASVNLTLYSIGAEGETSIILKCENVSKIENITLSRSIETLSFEIPTEGDLIEVEYNNVTIGTCKISSTGLKIPTPTVVPVTESMNVTYLLSYLESNIDRINISNIIKMIPYIEGEHIKSLIAIVNSTNLKINYITISNVAATCIEYSTIGEYTFYICDLPQNSNLTVSEYLVFNVYTNMGEIPVSENLTVESPYLNINTTWISDNIMSFNISSSVLKFREVSIIIEISNTTKIRRQITFNSSGLAQIALTISPMMFSGVNNTIIILRIGSVVVEKYLAVYPLSRCPPGACMLNNVTISSSVLALPKDCDNCICLPGYVKEIITVNPG